MTTTVANLTASANFTAPNAQFNKVFTPVANIAAANVKVSQNVQVDLSAMFNYTHCGFAWDLGYNFWMTTAEKIKNCGNNNTIVQSNYALKGDASVFGFAGSPVVANAVALSASESAATICSGTNITLTSPAVTATTSINQRVDNAQLAFNGAHVALLNANVPQAHVDTSLNPVVLLDSNLDKDGARSKGLSNRVFTHLSYTWEDHDCYVPYLGIGGSAEFVAKKKNCANATPCSNSSGCTAAVTTTSCNSSCDNNSSNVRRTNVSQWGIWLKGGVSFN